MTSDYQQSIDWFFLDTNSRECNGQSRIAMVLLVEEILHQMPPQITLPETSSSHLKIDVLNTSFLLERPILRGYVSFTKCKLFGTHENRTFSSHQKVGGQPQRISFGTIEGTNRTGLHSHGKSPSFRSTPPPRMQSSQMKV